MPRQLHQKSLIFVIVTLFNANNNAEMTNCIDEEFIRKHNLLECLNEFTGAIGQDTKEKSESLNSPFQALAKKALYGGYFVVKSGKKVLHRVYIHTVEFYYHEEMQGGLRDWIVYHKNPLKGNPKDAFPIGTFNSHQSGVDITFEEQTPDLKNPKYRASFLIRSFKVTTGDNEEFIEFGKYPDHMKSRIKDVEFYPTHLYDYLFMQAPITDISIGWQDDNAKEYGTVFSGQRINVFEYEPKEVEADAKAPVMKKNEKKLDDRKWAFSKDQLEISIKGVKDYTFE